MGDLFSTILDKAPELVKTPLGLIGLCVLVGAYLIAFWKKARFDSLMAKIEALPKGDRLEALKSEMGSVPIPANFAPADWLMAQRQKYFFAAYFITAALVVILVVSTIFFGDSGPTTITIDGDSNSAIVDSEVNTGN